jgi:hypothetical protein
MQTIERVGQSLGLSVRAVRLRRDMLDGVLDAHVKRGEKGALLFNGEALAILRRVEDLRHGESTSVRQAVERVRHEIQGDGVPASRQPESASGETAVLRELIEEKERTIRRLEEDNARLQARVDQLLPLALPRPRRGILRLFRVGSA